MEKIRATKRFRAAGSIAQVCIQLYDSITKESGGGEVGESSLSKDEEDSNLTP